METISAQLVRKTRKALARPSSAALLVAMPAINWEEDS
jgi:hypothetical protein